MTRPSEYDVLPQEAIDEMTGTYFALMEIKGLNVSKCWASFVAYADHNELDRLDESVLAKWQELHPEIIAANPMLKRS